MAADQKNSTMYTYVDDNGVSWNKRGPIDAAINAVDGSTSFATGQPLWLDSKAHKTRKAVYEDATTFRTISFTVFTPTAFAAHTTGATLSVHVPGETAAVTYNFSRKTPERQRAAKASRNLADHA